MSLSSRNNPKIKQVRQLRQRKHRQESGLFVVEGIRHVGEALHAGAQVEYIVYAEARLTSDFAYQLIQSQQPYGVPCLLVEGEVFDSLAERENPQGILAVVRQLQAALDDLTPANCQWAVALVSPQDPGNIGTILRSMDAVGADALILLDDSADPYHGAAVRASMGALFWLPLVHASFADFSEWIRRHTYHVYGTSAHASLDYRSISAYASPRVLLLGSEREGLTGEQAAACEQLIRLPMHGKVTSLNLAVAAGVMLYAMLGKPDRQVSTG
jgi:RNA methyltransferase, TrmH family